ncbi:MAG: DUF4153 domain-containing protein [Eubacteriales bacterium]
MKKFKDWRIKENIVKVMKTYPVFLFSLIAIGILTICLIHIDNLDEDIIIKINLSIAVFAGFALNLRAIKLSYDTFSTKYYIIILSVCFLLSAGYYFTIEVDQFWSAMITFIIYFIQGLLFISLPFIRSDDKSEHFANLAAGRLFISGLLYGIAYGGIAGVLFALEELFGINISEDLYADFAVILATTFLPMLWLVGLDYKIEPSTKKLYKVLLSYVCIPLLFVYSAVVYGYIIFKIMLTGFKMPHSIIGHLVLWYSFVSVVVAYLARPYKDNPITKFFFDWYPIISIAPIGVMFVAIFMRINQYALTINRYYLLLGGIWLAVIFAYMIYMRVTKKKPRNIVITLSIALFALISIAEPISANSAAQVSQINRLEKTLSPYLKDDTLDMETIKTEDLEQAQDILQYLSRIHDGYGIYDESSETFNEKITFINHSQAMDILNARLSDDTASMDKNRYIYAMATEENRTFPPVDVDGYKYLLAINGYDFNNGDIYLIDDLGIKIKEVTNDDGEIVDYRISIYENGEIINEFLMSDCYGEKIIQKKQSFGEDSTDFIYEDSEISFKIVLTSLHAWYSADVGVIGFEGYILLK